mmetsp:Transcript_5126/g.18736  ORF Transcript_5126/g.18736 Transcript_5126/m.18736 type:complete len:1950 (-) Transcript_5126:161-6010(-)
MRANLLQAGRRLCEGVRDMHDTDRGAVHQLVVGVLQNVAQDCYRVGHQAHRVRRNLPADVSRGGDGHPLHARREKVQVRQHRHERTGAQASARMFGRHLLQGLQRLFGQVNVLNIEQSRAERGQAIVVHHGRARGGQHVHEMGQGPGRQEHDVRIVLVVEQPHQQRHESIQGKGGQRVFGRHGEHLAKGGECLHLAALVALGAEAREDGLHARRGQAVAWQEVIQARAQLAQEAVQRRARVCKVPRQGGVGPHASLSRNLANASTALHGLLRKLGAGLDDLLPGHGLPSARMKAILSGLRAEGDESRQMEALSSLCEVLSMSSEDSLASFSLDAFVPLLVGLLNYEHNPDIMLLAARALTHLMDVLPSSCAAVVHYDGLPSFCSRLLNIEYIDLAEQSLQALEKVSAEHPSACLRAGALMAVLAYLDFFPTGVQRVAVSTAANICRQIPSDSVGLVSDAVAILSNILQYSDHKLVDRAAVCIMHIADSFTKSPSSLEKICAHGGLLENIVALLAIGDERNSQVALAPATYSGLVRALSTFCANSANAVKRLYELGITSTLCDILKASSTSIASPASPYSQQCHQLQELLGLANELLPAVPEDQARLAELSSPGRSVSRGSSRSRARIQELEAVGAAKSKLFEEKPGMVVSFGTDMYSTIAAIFTASVNPMCRLKCLLVLWKVVHFSTADALRTLLRDQAISSFLAGVLMGKDYSLVFICLCICEELMQKLPDIFGKHFVKEGVVHAIKELASYKQAKEVNAGGLSTSARKTTKKAPGPNAAAAAKSGSGSSSRTPAADEKGKRAADGLISPHTPGGTEEATRASLAAQAEELQARHFCAASKGEVATEGLKNLRMGICDKFLRNGGADAPTNSTVSPEYVGKMVQKLLHILREGEGVSTFELMESGLAVFLCNFLTGGRFHPGAKSSLAADKAQLVETRLRSMAKVLYEGTADGYSMEILLDRLQAALSSSEQFPLLLSYSQSQGSNSLAAPAGSSLSALAQPFKLRLVRDFNDHSLRDYSTNVVLIEPLATAGAIEDFLWPRIRRPEATSIGAAPDGVGQGSENAPRRSSSRAGKEVAQPAGATTRARAASSSKGEDLASGAAPMDADDATQGQKSHNKTKVKAGEDSDAPRQERELRFRREDTNARARGSDAGDTAPKSGSGRRTRREELLELAGLLKDRDEEMEDGGDDADELGDLADLEELEDALDAEMDEEADLLDGLPHPDRVHDVQLTDAEAGGADGAAPGREHDTRGTGSYASAATRELAEEGAGGPSASREARSGRHSGPQRLIISLGAQDLNPSVSIFQAIQRHVNGAASGEERARPQRLWESVYTLRYRRAGDVTSAQDKASTAAQAQREEHGGASAAERASKATASHELDQLKAMLPKTLQHPEGAHALLFLLRAMHNLYCDFPRLALAGAVEAGESWSRIQGVGLSTNVWQNSKLTQKLLRQLQDVLVLCSGGLPDWCRDLLTSMPFLITFEARCQYFYCTALGLSRALHRLQQQNDSSSGLGNPNGGNDGRGGRELRVGRLQRQKVRVTRSRILESATKVMELYASNKAVLEVQFFGEVGTGLGPTLEFYTLLSHELMRTKASAGMWRTGAARAPGEKVDAEYVSTTHGLFPAPMRKDDPRAPEVTARFKLLGRTAGKALQDSRLLDIPLAPAFYRRALGRPLTLFDLVELDPELGANLQELAALAHKYRRAKAAKGARGARPDPRKFTLKGARVEDLCLDFTCPGFPEYELVQQGASKDVTLDNLDEYVEAVLDGCVGEGIAQQMQAFVDGFNQVFTISALHIFSPEEVDTLLCGMGETWKKEQLVETMKFDHGYTQSSPPVVHFLEIMCEFTPEEQRAFLRFVTGSPRLPPGGLASLAPPLTIVRKHPQTPSGAPSQTNVPPTAQGTPLADGDLPSVMTCANYLKLPPYSSKAIMKQRLLFAIADGQGSFDLS